MELFATDLERLAFLLEADAALTLDPDTLGSEAAEQSAPEEREAPQVHHQLHRQ